MDKFNLFLIPFRVTVDDNILDPIAFIQMLMNWNIHKRSLTLPEM